MKWQRLHNYLKKGNSAVKKGISDYERKKVESFLCEVYLTKWDTLDKNVCISEGWIVYLEIREKYNYCRTETEYWNHIQFHVEKSFNELRRNRNNIIRLESNLSLNHSYGECREEIGTIFPQKDENFINKIIVKDYMNRLDSVKAQIVCFLYCGETDYEIIKRMNLSKDEYHKLKKEIQKEFKNYIKKNA